MNPVVEVGKKYIITRSDEGGDWQVGNIISPVKEVTDCSLLYYETSKRSMPAHRHSWCPRYYQFKEYNKETLVNNPTIEIGNKYRTLAEGDKVKILAPTLDSDDTQESADGGNCYFSRTEMGEYIGKVGTVVYVHTNPDNQTSYYVEVDGDRWYYIQEWLELVEEKENLVELEEANMHLDMTPDLAMDIITSVMGDNAKIKVVDLPEYKGKYKVTLFYTNGKQFRQNNVADYFFTEASADYGVDEAFQYTMKDFSNTSFIVEEIVRHIKVDQLAGYLAEDDNGLYELRVLKPCFYEKHSVHIGKRTS